VVRHAIAHDRVEFRGPDEERPLSARGRERFARAAEMLAAYLPDLGRIATSPLVRARQTAELLAAAYDEPPELFELDELRPGTPAEKTLHALDRLRHAGVLAVIGHEPDLALLASRLLAGSERSFLRFKKGGAALLEVEGRLCVAGATLLWHLTPAQMRDLAP